jgi:hypothetical protein
MAAFIAAARGPQLAEEVGGEEEGRLARIAASHSG